MYKVQFVKSALKDLKSIPRKDRTRILESVKVLAANPFSELIKYRKIKSSENLFRIRIGEYRIVYSVEKDILVVVIIRIGHRKDVYRGIH